MASNEKRMPLRALMLISPPKLAKKAITMFQKKSVPILYQWNAVGTAPSEMIDILGLGDPDKIILVSIVTRPEGEEILKRMKKDLKLGSVNSGIAFTLPLNGASNMIVHLADRPENKLVKLQERKEGTAMGEANHVLITVVINQGYSEEVMTTAREAGAVGGTVVHSRQVANQDTVARCGMNLQEEKETLLIVADQEDKVKIMQAISGKWGINSDAKGVVISLPIDSAIGIG